MGWLPLAAALVARTLPRVVNAVSHAPVLARVAKLVAGVDRRREIPIFATTTFQQWFRDRTPRGNGSRGEIVLWPDTFTNHFDPAIASSAVEVIEDAGWRVQVPAQAVCCGLTWISTGQLDTAKRVLQRTVEILRPYLRRGTLIVGLEPSCTAVFRSDAHELFPTDEDVQRLCHQTVTLAELLHEHSPEWRPPQISRTAHVQTHCHHHAVMGYQADRAILKAMDVTVDVLDSGCCGLAGNFGFEAGHYEVSEACAERVLLPAVRDADAHDVILADGFSCRTQVAQSDAGGRRAVHLAELIRAGQRHEPAGAHPEDVWTHRPPAPSAAARGLAFAAAAVGSGLVAKAVVRVVTRRASARRHRRGRPTK